MSSIEAEGGTKSGVRLEKPKAHPSYLLPPARLYLLSSTELSRTAPQSHLLQDKDPKIEFLAYNYERVAICNRVNSWPSDC